VIGLALALAAATPNDDLVQKYIRCVGYTSVRMEPSGESPTDIADAAKFLCKTERAAAVISSRGAGGVSAEFITEMENSASAYGRASVVIKRLCLKAKDCIP
jgi:hypothetical protein